MLSDRADDSMRIVPVEESSFCRGFRCMEYRLARTQRLAWHVHVQLSNVLTSRAVLFSIYSAISCVHRALAVKNYAPSRTGSYSGHSVGSYPSDIAVHRYLEPPDSRFRATMFWNWRRGTEFLNLVHRRKARQWIQELSSFRGESGTLTRDDSRFLREF